MPNLLIVLSNDPTFERYSYYQDWAAGFLQHTECDILDIQDWGFVRQRVGLRRRYDAIIFLHSVFMALYHSRRLGVLQQLLRSVGGERVFFLSNEFRNLDNMTQMAQTLGARWIVSQLQADDAQLLYQSLWEHELLSMPYGFDPETFKPTVPANERPIDIGFRGDYYPAYVGHDDRDILLDALNSQLEGRAKADIQVGERFERLEWAAFLNQCRALVGHEAGATRIDSDENIRHFINAQEKRLSPDAFRQLMLTMRETGVFDPPPSGRIAAPRNFEAMGTKTVQILLPGRYNDVLEAGTHYIELQRDFSNLDRVLDTLFDDTAYTAIAERAYDDALAHHTYAKRVETLLKTVL